MHRHHRPASNSDSTPTADVTVIGIGIEGSGEGAIQHAGISFEGGPGRVQRRLAEAKPMAPQTKTEAHGFPCRPVRDARSAEWELTSPFIWTPPVCQGILCAGRQEGCGFISGLVAGRTRWPRWIPLAHASFVTRAVSPQRASGLVSPGLTCVPSHSITLRNL